MMNPITLEKYLAQEGHRNQSHESITAILEGKFTTEQIEQYNTLSEQFMNDNCPANIRAFYNYLASTGIMHAFENGHWERSMTFMPKISEQIKPGMKVIDLGCSDGFKTAYYALAHPDATFVGNDIRIEALALAKRRAEGRGLKNLSFAASDNTLLAFNGAFDLAISDHNFHETTNFDEWNEYPNKMFQLSRILKPGAKAVIVLSPGEPYALQGLLDYTGRAEGLQMEFSLVDYTRFGEMQTDLFAIARKTN